MIVLGIDPGSIHLGFAIVRLRQYDEPELLEMGTLDLPPKEIFAKRLGLIQDRLQLLVEKFQPGTMVIEKIFAGVNIDTAFRLGHVRGVCMAVAANHGADVVEIAARQVKKLVVGNGGADKDQIQLMLKQMYPLNKEMSYDATDALALTVAFSRTRASNLEVKGANP